MPPVRSTETTRYVDLPSDRNSVLTLGSAPVDKRSPRQKLRAWIMGGRTRREWVEKNAADLLERFGPAAPRIARNCARRAAGPEERRLWVMVVRRIDRRASSEELGGSNR